MIIPLCDHAADEVLAEVGEAARLQCGARRDRPASAPGGRNAAKPLPNSASLVGARRRELRAVVHVVWPPSQVCICQNWPVS